MPYVSRGADGAVTGLYANPQAGYAGEFVGDNDPAIAAYLAPKVTSVTPRQARLALLGVGLLDQVQSAVDAAGGATKITWEYATAINRDDPLIATLGSSLSLAPAQIDQLFATASTL